MCLRHANHSMQLQQGTIKIQDHKTTNLGVRGSNPFRCANYFNGLTAFDVPQKSISGTPAELSHAFRTRASQIHTPPLCQKRQNCQNSYGRPAKSPRVRRAPVCQICQNCQNPRPPKSDCNHRLHLGGPCRLILRRLGRDWSRVRQTDPFTPLSARLHGCTAGRAAAVGEVGSSEDRNH